MCSPLSRTLARGEKKKFTASLISSLILLKLFWFQVSTVSVCQDINFIRPLGVNVAELIDLFILHFAI